MGAEEKIKDYVVDLMKKAEKGNERRIMFFLGKGAKFFATVAFLAAFNYLREKGKDPEVKIFSDDPEWEIGPVSPMAELERILGTTCDIMVLDFRGGFFPNDLGRAGGVVRGGGLYIILGESPDEWKLKRYHERILAYPYTLETMDNYFMKRFLKKAFSHSGTTVVVDGEIVKEDETKPKRKKRKKVEVPPEGKFSEDFYLKCITQDQADSLKKLEGIYQGKEKVAVLISDRGRGKSSLLGIFVAAFLHHSKGKKKIVLTAPHPENVIEVFKFAEEMLRGLGYKVKVEKDKRGYTVSLTCKKGYLDYYSPLKASRQKGDLFIVDEAASLQVPMLNTLLGKAPKIIYSTTIHGYEGAGRGFSIRFLGNLKKKNVKYKLIEMHEPIRYSENDPVENFLFDVLLLDAEPEEVDVKDLNKLELRIPSKEELIEDEKLFREYFSIFVLAHYKNNPNDLALLLDTPNHIPAMLLYEGKVVCSMQLAFEGRAEKLSQEMLQGAKINGHMIPDRMVKYYRVPEFAKYWGIRVVRIAVHPENMDRGIGSTALRMIEERFKKEIDWIGSGFGATPELIRFWIRNGYLPFHMAPTRNEVSGEYSIMVLKPINPEVEEYVKMANREFVIRLFESLEDVYRDLEISIVRQIAKTHDLRWRARLTEKQKERAWAYAFGPLTYEVARDVVRELVLTYFLDSERRVKLNGREEKMVIMRVLQCASPEEIERYFKIPYPYFMASLRDVIGKLVTGYEEVKV